MAELSRDTMLEAYLFECNELLAQLEEITLNIEQTRTYSLEDLNELFRITHTIKGSSAMMSYHDIAALAHSLEDLLHFIREENPSTLDLSTLTDLILKGKDFIQRELATIEAGEEAATDSGELVDAIRGFLAALKTAKPLPAGSPLLPPPESGSGERQSPPEDDPENQRYKAVIFFEDGCLMEHVRAFAVLHQIKDLVSDISYLPWDISDDSNAREIIRQEGFTIYFRTEDPEAVRQRLMKTAFLERLEMEAVAGEEELAPAIPPPPPASGSPEEPSPPEDDLESQKYKAVIFFEDGCRMEHVRAFAVLHQIKDLVSDISYLPWDISDDSNAREIIRQEGFTIYFRTEDPEAVHQRLMATPFLERLEMEAVEEEDELGPNHAPSQREPAAAAGEGEKNRTKESRERKAADKHDNNYNNASAKSPAQNFISVSVTKIDKLMNLVGEMVIAESMVVQNPDLKGLSLDNFEKSARHLNKITSELREIIMSIRMVPLSATFRRMNRIVRDMCRKLGKEVQLEIVGEETEVDKNVIEHIADPLIHLVRNAIDHGIETPAEREAQGKKAAGTITLEAKNAGGDVLIIVRDDGRGLDRETILRKAEARGVLPPAAEGLTDQEIYNLILLPGFSTRDEVSEYSGRGVGMDVVKNNIEKIGGSVMIDSRPGQGTTFTLKIPLTLAIIDGINIKVGDTHFTIPTITIQSIFVPRENEITVDPDGNEMIIVRGKCHPVIRLHQFYKIKKGKTNFSEGILVMVEQDGKTACLFADELLGQQQVVIKSLPHYIRHVKKSPGIVGCTLLGDGSISLVLDLPGLVGAFTAL